MRIYLIASLIASLFSHFVVNQQSGSNCLLGPYHPTIITLQPLLPVHFITHEFDTNAGTTTCTRRFPAAVTLRDRGYQASINLVSNYPKVVLVPFVSAWCQPSCPHPEFTVESDKGKQKCWWKKLGVNNLLEKVSSLWILMFRVLN